MTKRSLVSPSRSSSNCNLLRSEDEEAGLEVSTGVPLGRLRSWKAKKQDPNEYESLPIQKKKLNIKYTFVPAFAEIPFLNWFPHHW